MTDDFYNKPGLFSSLVFEAKENFTNWNVRNVDDALQHHFTRLAKKGSPYCAFFRKGIPKNSLPMILDSLERDFGAYCLVKRYYPEKDILDYIRGNEEDDPEEYTKNMFLDKPRSFVYMLENGYITITERSKQIVEIDLCCIDEKIFDKVKDFFIENIIVKKQPDSAEAQTPVFVLVQGEGGLSLRKLGTEGCKYIPENYIQSVQDGFKYIVEQLSSPKPRGRLCIFTGAPGCGKTFFIRSILNEVKNSVFVYIPPSYVQELSGPGVLGALLDAQEMTDSKNIIIILEDADEVLTTRMSDNMSQISGLLNLTDGFVGNCLNIKIIATTNAKRQEIETASIRPGRLCKILNFDKLEPEQCKKVFSSISAEKEYCLKENKSYTLAEIYEAASGEISDDVKNQEEKKGFGF